MDLAHVEGPSGVVGWYLIRILPGYVLSLLEPI